MNRSYYHDIDNDSDACEWECFVYYGEGDSGDFSVSNSDVLAAYGYNGDIVYGG